jgi:hypothetical protein
VSDPFDDAILQSYSRAAGGEDMDLVVGEDGFTTYALPEPEVQPEPMPASMTRKDRRGQEPTITPMEGLQQFGEAMGGALTGLLPGAVAGSVGTPGDLAGLFAGAYEAATAEEGERLNEFLQTLTDISGQYGSEAALSFGRSVAESLPVSDQVKEGIAGGLEAGSFVGIGGTVTKGGKAIAEGVRNYAAGAPARVAERGTGTTLQSGVDPMAAVDEAIVGAQKLFGAETQPAQSIVSSRLPTAKAATEDPLQTRLQVGIESSKADSKAFNKNAQVITQYPNVRYQGDNPDEAANDLITHVKDNLLYLYDSVPDQTRQRSKQWYVGARKIVDDLSTEYELPDQAVAGVMAVLSPQKDWFMNVSLGKRVVDIHTTKANEPWTDDMMTTATRIFGQEKYAPILNGIAGKTYDQLETPGEKAMWLRIYDETYNPREHNVISPEGETQGVRLSGKGEAFKTGWGSLSEIGKAVDILMNPDLANVSSRLGDQHKVRSFYNNMYAPMDEAGDVTIDTHAVAAGLLKPLSGKSTEVTHNFGGTGIANSSVTGSKGTYGLYAEAYRQAAKERGVLPREMQSITWEAVRGLFPAGYKSQAANVEYVDNIWRQYKSGGISLEEARDAIIKHAGGIEAPEWERSGGTAPAEVQNASNARELPGASVPEPKPRRSGRGRNRRNSRANQTEQINTESPDSGMGGDR